jgi:hypothetical protein
LALYCLQTGHRYAENEEIKDKFEQGIRFLWYSMSANSFTPAQGRLAGSFSRCYDFIYGQGSVIIDFYLYGLTNFNPPESFSFMSDTKAVSNHISGGFRPDQKILELANLYPRIIKEKFGPRNGQDRYCYITNDYAIGSSSYFYCNYDRQINVSLKSEKYLPQVTLFTDCYDAAYGEHPGFSKPFHFKNSLATVQDEGLILTVMRVEPHLSKIKFEDAATHFSVPTASDRIYIDGEAISADKAFEHKVSDDSMISVYEGNSLINFRYLMAEGIHSYQSNYKFEYDNNKAGMALFTAQHYKGRKTGAEKPVYVIALLQAVKCTNPGEIKSRIASFQNADIRIYNEIDSLTAAVGLNDTSLKAGLSKKDGAITCRQVNKAAYEPDVFSVNGVDYATLCLPQYTKAENFKAEPSTPIRKIEIANGDFENGLKNWSAKYDPEVFFTVTGQAGFEGKGLRLEDTSETEPARLLSYLLPCNYGKEYELRFKYRVSQSNNARRGISVGIEFLDIEGKPINPADLKHPEWYHVLLSPIGKDWNDESVRVSTLKNATSMRIFIISDRYSVNTADFDCFELSEILK